MHRRFSWRIFQEISKKRISSKPSNYAMRPVSQKSNVYKAVFLVHPTPESNFVVSRRVHPLFFDLYVTWLLMIFFWCTSRKGIDNSSIPNLNIHPLVLLEISKDVNKAYDLFPPEEKQRWITPLPSEYNESQLYDLLHPFGPISSIHIDKNLGGVVQFWTEDDACNAEKNLTGTTLPGQTFPLTITAYHFRTIFCTVSASPCNTIHIDH